VLCFDLNRFFISLQRGLYSNRKFSSYLDPDKAEARFRVKIKHPHGGEKNKLSFALTLNRFFFLLQRGSYSNRKFCSYLFPDKAEARFRVKIKHQCTAEQQKKYTTSNKRTLTTFDFFLLPQNCRFTSMG